MHIDPNWVIAALALVTTILVPILIILVRGAIKWTRTEDKLGMLVDDVRELVQNKDRVHSELLRTMSQMNDSMDKRVRFLEEHFMLKRDQN